MVVRLSQCLWVTQQWINSSSMFDSKHIGPSSTSLVNILCNGEPIQDVKLPQIRGEILGSTHTDIDFPTSELCWKLEEFSSLWNELSGKSFQINAPCECYFEKNCLFCDAVTKKIKQNCLLWPRRAEKNEIRRSEWSFVSICKHKPHQKCTKNKTEILLSKIPKAYIWKLFL